MSCVPPYPVELEVRPNTPPVIFNEEASPPVTLDPVFAQLAEGCGAATFSVPVVDYDGDAQFFFKWIFTPDNELLPRELVNASAPTQDTEEALVSVLGEEGLVAAPLARVVPDLQLELSVELISTVIQNPNQLNLGTHLLELFVTDRPFELGTFNVEPSRSPGEPRQTAARAAWFVNTVTEPCP